MAVNERTYVRVNIWLFNYPSRFELIVNFPFKNLIYIRELFVIFFRFLTFVLIFELIFIYTEQFYNIFCEFIFLRLIQFRKHLYWSMTVNHWGFVIFSNISLYYSILYIFAGLVDCQWEFVVSISHLRLSPFAIHKLNVLENKRKI